MTRYLYRTLTEAGWERYCKLADSGPLWAVGEACRNFWVGKDPGKPDLLSSAPDPILNMPSRRNRLGGWEVAGLGTVWPLRGADSPEGAFIFNTDVLYYDVATWEWHVRPYWDALDSGELDFLRLPEGNDAWHLVRGIRMCQERGLVPSERVKDHYRTTLRTRPGFWEETVSEAALQGMDLLSLTHGMGLIMPPGSL